MAPTVSLKCALRVVGDVSVVIIIGVTSLLIRHLATPFHRGFFKDDESLMHPYIHKSTISAAVLYGVGFSLPVLAIMLVEGGWAMTSRGEQKGGHPQRSVRATWLWSVYHAVLMFSFGVVLTHLTTNIPKYVIGRLRPHFFAVCQPDWTRVPNEVGYTEDDVCLGNDTAAITEARVSFPSGHSSMAIYCMLFLALYLQERLVWQAPVLLKPFFQTVPLLLGSYTCLSRVSDYKHHWTDVLAGAIMGAGIAILVWWSLREKCLQPERQSLHSRNQSLMTSEALGGVQGSNINNSADIVRPSTAL